jgi:hypothetical protein
LSVESISSFRLVLGDDFFFSALVFAFLIPVLSNQLGRSGEKAIHRYAITISSPARAVMARALQACAHF